MNNKEYKILCGIIIGIFVVIAIFALIGIYATIRFCCTISKSEPIQTNVVNVDSISKINDSIKLKVETLDSIKNAKVIEVNALDNDSSIKLFYKLVSE